MLGPFSLSDANISKLDDDTYGVYVLIYNNTDAQLVVYVGRGIVKDRMREHIDEKEAHAF